jgi:hypothetical protein
MGGVLWDAAKGLDVRGRIVAQRHDGKEKEGAHLFFV